MEQVIFGVSIQSWENGNGLFVLLYIFFVITLGLPVFMAEVFIGKKGKATSIIGRNLAKSKSSKSWNIIGYGGILASLIIAGYYAVIADIVNYGFISATGVETGAAEAIYNAEKANFTK